MEQSYKFWFKKIEPALFFRTFLRNSISFEWNVLNRMCSKKASNWWPLGQWLLIVTKKRVKDQTILSHKSVHISLWIKSVNAIDSMEKMAYIFRNNDAKCWSETSPSESFWQAYRLYRAARYHDIDDLVNGHQLTAVEATKQIKSSTVIY